MKQKIIMAGVVLVILAALSTWIFNRPESLGNINRISKLPETNSSTITFEGKAGDTIKFSFASDIEEGELNITLSDSKGNVVKQLPQATELETFATLETSDTYKLMADYSDFIGNFQVKLYQMKR